MEDNHGNNRKRRRLVGNNKEEPSEITSSALLVGSSNKVTTPDIIFRGTINCASFLYKCLETLTEFEEKDSYVIHFHCDASGVKVIIRPPGDVIHVELKLNLVDYQFQFCCSGEDDGCGCTIEVYAPQFRKVIRSCCETSRFLFIEATENEIYLEASSPFAKAQYTFRSSLVAAHPPPQHPTHGPYNQSIYIDSSRLKQELDGWVKAYPRSLKKQSVLIQNQKVESTTPGQERHLRFELQRNLRAKSYEIKKFAFTFRQRSQANQQLNLNRLNNQGEQQQADVVQVYCSLDLLRNILGRVVSSLGNNKARFDVAKNDRVGYPDIIRLQYECTCHECYPPKIMERRQQPPCTLFQVYFAPME